MPRSPKRKKAAAERVATAVQPSSRERDKLLKRARRLAGQADAIERAILADRTCLELVNLMVATRGALNALIVEVVREHVVDHVVDPSEHGNARGLAAQELLSILKSYI